MKKIICIFILILGILALISESVNEFSETKFFYSSFYPDKYFVIDELKYSNKIPVDGNVGTGLYYYEGVLVKHGLSKRVMRHESNLHKVLNKNENIRVWFNKLTERIMIRNSKHPPKPFSYKLLDAWMPIVSWVLWFPALFYYLQIRKKEKQVL